MKCVYCGYVGKMSREHVFPHFLYKMNPDVNVGFNMAAMKYIESQHTIKDVCEPCNNGPLSQLSIYGKDLYLENDFDSFFRHRPRNVNFSYDYHTLSRFLLSITFNVGRAADSDTEIFDSFKDYIRSGSHIGAASFSFDLYLELLSSSIVPPEFAPTVDGGGAEMEYLDPAGFRAGKSYGAPSSIYSIRHVAINSWFFRFFFREASTPQHLYDEALRKFISQHRYITKIWKNRDFVVVPVSNTTFYDSKRDDFGFKKELWDQYTLAKTK